MTRDSFCVDLGTPSAPFWHHFGAKIEKMGLRNDIENHSVFYCVFFIDFRSILAPKSMTPFVEKASYSAPKIRLRAPGGSFGPFLALWCRFRVPFWSFWTPCWCFRVRFWCHFGGPVGDLEPAFSTRPWDPRRNKRRTPNEPQASR